MHWLWNFFLAKRQFTWLLITALVIMGGYAVLVIPKESAPEVIVPIGIVQTTYPGASAADIEELITDKIEEKVGNLENLESLSSVSQDGISVVTVEFTADADIDASLQDLKDAVDTAKGDLPRDANEPFVTEVNFSDQPILIVSVSANLPPTAFTQLGEDVSDVLKGVSGVSDVIVSGTREREIQVVIQQESLATYGLTFSDVTRALQSANLALPIGTVSTKGVEYAIRFESDIENTDAIGDIPVTVRNGQPVFIRDIAHVTDGVGRTQTLSRVSLEGNAAEDAMTLAIKKNAGSDVTKVAERVRTEIAALQKESGLLEGSQVLIVFDQGANVKKDLSELVTTGFETVVLVVICLLLTIGWRESLVAALSIPLSFVVAFIGLYLSGNTINFVSLFALILAVGILVDSGIVVTEAIHTRVRRFGNPEKAAHEAVREYAWPLIAGTMTTVAVFVPLFFLSGVTGEFIASIPYTIIFVLLASILVALGMVPLIAIRLTKEGGSNRFEEIQEVYTHKAQAWYRTKLITFLESKKMQRVFLYGLALAFVAVLFLPVSGLMKVVFFPGEDVDTVYVEIEAKQGTPIGETDLAVRAVEEILYEQDYVESFTSTVGTGSSFIEGSSAGSKFGNITVTLKDERTLSSAETAESLRTALSALRMADFKVTEQANGPPSGAPVVLQFYGEDLDTLARITDEAEKVLKSIPGTRDTTTSTKSNTTEIVLSIDKAKAGALGISPLAVGEALRSAVFGITATTITTQGDDIDVVAKIQLGETHSDPSRMTEATIADIKNLSIETPTGSVLLGSVLSESLGSAHASIVHKEKERLETVSAYTSGDTTASEIVTAFKAREGELQLPENVRISYGGETEDINRSFTEMFVALIAGLVFMLAILVLSFNSVRYALYLLLAVPYSLIGVFLGLTLTGQPLSFTSLLGVIALAGVIINHAIILMDSLLHIRNERTETASLIDIVADASVSRLRPIFLTTVTTVIGMVPLSTISDFWSPLAFAIMFGLAFAMILTLILVPTLFYRHESKVRAKAQKA